MVNRHELDTTHARGIRQARGLLAAGSIIGLLSVLSVLGGNSDAGGGVGLGLLLCGAGQLWHWIHTGRWMGRK